jgi:hypothetical protein
MSMAVRAPATDTDLSALTPSKTPENYRKDRTMSRGDIDVTINLV